MKPILRNLYLLAIVSICCNTTNVFGQQNTILDSVIQVLEAKSIYKDRVNWNNLKKTVSEKLNRTASDPVEQALPAIRRLYTELGDRHGKFMTKTKTVGSYGTNEHSTSDSILYQYAFNEKYAFRTAVIDNKYGYFVLPSSQLTREEYTDSLISMRRISHMAQQLQDSLCSLSNYDLKGLIIDLRLCMGGTLSIDLGALIPLLGDGNLFSITNIGLRDQQIRISSGSIYINNTKQVNTLNKCSFKGKKIVVITGPITGSAGEMTAVAMRKIEGVKFIGEPTAGYLTMTDLHHLSGEVSFSYSVGYVKDNNNRVYRDTFVPDIHISGGDNFPSLKDDEKIKAAIKWMEVQ
ncbi:S41 family peptidase [Sphingobacterium sp.]|uniref:S41 family peptidase n=1 Tax=Sphingobacterium sp. TaxID=341027 RepID=UPI002896FC29|nr:S41 family peptidase [Sphingobacterium sp.]